MTQTSITIEPIHATVVVAAPIERAFDVFAREMTRWWPPAHHIGEAPFVEAVVEPRTGGRWYERAADGRECEWGTVLAWEPPHRLVLGWAIGTTWQYDPNPAHTSEVEVRFHADGADRTRVELTHRHLERHGADAAQLRVPLDAGWASSLEAFAQAVSR